MKLSSQSVDIDQEHIRLLNMGLVVNVLVPIIILCGGVFLRSRGIGDMTADRELDVFFWALMAVALGEIPVIYIVKRQFLSEGKPFQRSCAYVTPFKALSQWGMVIFSLCLAPTIYGLVYYLLGGTLERFVLFVAITLFCFLVFKLKLEEVRSFVKRQSNSLDDLK